jgi:hypothetical protein
MADEADDRIENWASYHGPLHDRDFPCVTAYFDESGHSASTKVVAIGGAMATPVRWGELRVKWSSILAKYDVKTFHMADLENRQGEFRGWDEARKRGLLSEVLEAITESPMFMIGAAVVVEDFNRLNETMREKLMDPWYLCYQSCFEEVLSMFYVFDPEREGVERGLSNVRACFYEAHLQYKWGPILFAMSRASARRRGIRRSEGIIGWGTKATTVHFQVADFIAYELRKHIENAIYKQGRPTRWPMKQFLKTVFVTNVYDDTKTVIPVDGEQHTLFRRAALAELQPDGKVVFEAASRGEPDNLAVGPSE